LPYDINKARHAFLSTISNVIALTTHLVAFNVNNISLSLGRAYAFCTKHLIDAMQQDGLPG